MKLGPVQQKFVLHWGEMGTRWGLNRTVAQIHALLYISPKSLNAEEIAETLDVARSNVSNSLKELQSWRIVKLVHVLGDKRDHFESMRSVWEMFRIVLDERRFPDRPRLKFRFLEPAPALMIGIAYRKEPAVTVGSSHTSVDSKRFASRVEAT